MEKIIVSLILRTKVNFQVLDAYMGANTFVEVKRKYPFFFLFLFFFFPLFSLSFFTDALIF